MSETRVPNRLFVEILRLKDFLLEFRISYKWSFWLNPRLYCDLFDFVHYLLFATIGSGHQQVMSRALPNVDISSQTGSTVPPNANAPASPVTLVTASVPSQVTHLFRTKRVSEIRQFEARIREEADDKTDALRQLLGTRYRDLLLATDRISRIRDASLFHIRDSLRSIAGTALSLGHELDTRPWTQLANPSEPTSPTAADADLVRRRAIHTLGSRLKQIVDSPEILYAMLESGDLYDAAARFIAAKRNYHAVLETRFEEQRVTHDFLQSRWSLVSSFHTQILSSAERYLVNSELSISKHSHVLAAIIVLMDDCDVVSVVEGVLAARTTSLHTSLEHVRGDAVKLIRTIASLVYQTVSSMAHLFWYDDGSVEKLVRDIEPSAADAVRHARDCGDLSAAVVSWAADIRKWVQNHDGSLLAAATHSRHILDVFQAVDEEFSNDAWAEDCHAVLRQPPDFIFNILKPVICSRAADVVTKSVDEAIQRMIADIRDLWATIAKPLDASKAMWSLTSNHVVSCGPGKRSADINGHKLKLADEGRGIADMLGNTSPVGAVVESIDRLLNEVVTDVSALTNRVPSVLTTFEEAIQIGLPSILDNVHELVSSVSACGFGDAKELLSEKNELEMQRLLFAARVASALGTAEFVGRAYCIRSDGDSDTKQSAALAELCRSASEVSCHAHRYWAQILCSSHEGMLLEHLLDESGLMAGTGWTNNPNYEHDKELERSIHEIGAIRVPTTASTGIMRFLLVICKESSKAGGFGLSQEAEEILQSEVYSTCVRVYRLALKHYVESSGFEGGGENTTVSNKKNSEMAILQLLFDIQYLQLLLRDNQTSTPRRILPRELDKVEGEVQSSIDPIDFASSRKALKISITAYAARTSTLIGVLGSRNRKTWSAGRPAGGVSTSANLIELCKPVSRFTYLPAPMPSTYINGSVGTAGLNARAMVEALRNEAGSMNDGFIRKRETFDTSVAGYASKVSESVGRLGRGFFESLTRNVT